MKDTLTFFRLYQKPGNPHRADVEVGFDTVRMGTRSTGWAAEVHPQFEPIVVAAPKLLAALERMVAAFSKDKRSQLGAMVEARAAIAAAKEGDKK